MDICPVCNLKPVLKPHKVCFHCYEKIERSYNSPREIFEKSQEKQRLEWLEKGEILSQETIERNINFAMKDEAETWGRIVGDGLSAVFIMIEAIDEQEPSIIFHCRRIAFMHDLIHQLNPSLFFPATDEEIDNFMQAASDFWNGQISESERQKAKIEFSTILEDKKPSDWTAVSVLHWMINLQGHFDWMWFQWFECIYDAIVGELSDEIWIELFQKHFKDEIMQWACS